MTAILDRLRTNVCPDNHGCGVMPYCACSDMDDAAEEIERLTAEKAELVEALQDWTNLYAGWSVEELHKRADPATVRKIENARAALARAKGDA